MRNYASDPILGNGLIFDIQFNQVMTDLLAGGGTVYLFDQGPNRIQATCVSFVAGTWAIETPGVTPIQTIDLDGTADYVNLGTGAAFDTIATTNAMTFEIVALPDAIGTDMLMAGYVHGTGGQACYPQMLINGSGFVEFRPTQDTGVTVSVVIGSVNITAGTVHHITATFDESDNIAEILIDGGDTDSALATIVCANDTLPTLGAENFYIGTRWNQAIAGGGVGATFENCFDGHIYWARMWNRRLSRRERLLLYERARTVLGL